MNNEFDPQPGDWVMLRGDESGRYKIVTRDRHLFEVGRPSFGSALLIVELADMDPKWGAAR